MPLPFDNYPQGGRVPLGKKSGDNCRRGYGLKLMRLTGQQSCGYCGCSLVESYEHWLLTSVDHVVPESVCKTHRIPATLYDDYTNLLLCCLGCNLFANQYKKVIPDGECPTDWSLEQFYDLRDAVYLERVPLIGVAREKEMAFFESRPWESR